MGGACSTNGEKMNAYRLLVGKPERRRSLGRPRRRWMDNIRMDFVEVRWSDVNCELFIEPLGSIKCWETIECLNNWASLE
jgi:hypothetical protein